jgi:hypothetical protein
MGVLGGRTGGQADGRTVAARLALAAALILTFPAIGSGQTLGAPTAPGGPNVPDWLFRWSPIGLAGDLPRELPGANVSMPDLLTVPSPRVGSFWTAGNPAGMSGDVDESYSQMRLGYRDTKGAYRRPLDAGNDNRIGGSAFGWRPLPINGALAGRIVVDRVRKNDGAHADVVLPHTSNPFVVLDTLGDAVSGMVTRLDGAGGWNIGPLGIGVVAAYDGREIRTMKSTAPRRNRVSSTGAGAGLTYDILGSAVQIGAYARTERITQDLAMWRSSNRVFAVRGYYEAAPFNLTQATYYRLFERRAHMVGGSAAGHIAGVRWALFGQRERATERQSIDRIDDPITDDWDAKGWVAGFAAQLQVRDSQIMVTVSGRFSTLEGQASRMDLEQVTFDTDEAVWRLEADVRFKPSDAWAGAVRLGTSREDRLRHDSLYALGTHLHSWQPWVALEVARTLVAGVSLSAGLSYAQYAPSGSMPEPNSLDDAYREWIAPEVTIYANEASAKSGTITLLWQATPHLSYWARAATASLSGKTGVGSIGNAPDGARARGSVEVGVTWGGTNE